MRVKGLLVYHSIFAPDETYNQWKATIVVDKETREILREVGATVKRTEDVEKDTSREVLESFGEFFFATNRKVEGRGKRAGTKNQPPEVFLNGEPVSSPISIGYGSEVEVEFRPWSWTYKGRKGVSLDFEKINITKLVEYTPEEQEESSAPEPEASTEKPQW